MAMYVPLFSAVVAKYAGAPPGRAKLISLDEAFAGVDETNIRDMFRLMVEFDFNFMINSQILWGDYDTVSGAGYLSVDPTGERQICICDSLYLERKKKNHGDGKVIFKSTIINTVKESDKEKNGGYKKGQHAIAGMSGLFSETAGISEIV